MSAPGEEEESARLLSDIGSDTDFPGTAAESDVATDHRTDSWPVSKTAQRLYVSHFLSTCNSRVFEFGAVLYLATIFPGTLMPMSIYAVARGASAILLSSLVGQYIDRGNRLKVVRLSIVLQRSAVAASCVLFYILASGMLSSAMWKNVVLGIVTLLSCVEKLASIMNMVAVERDWVVTIAENDREYLPVMNSQMRRIDLICKLLGPFAIALVDGFSTEIAILVNLGMNVASIPMEYLFIAQIYRRVPQLQRQSPDEAILGTEEYQASRLTWTKAKVTETASKLGRDMKLYFKHPAFMPSFACALLYLTVLSFSGQMVTYLLSTGYTSTQVAIARTLSVGVEVMATWVGPWLMDRIGPVRAGLWFASWQTGCLFAGLCIFWTFSDRAMISASGLVGGTILSRLGLWGFDLCSQILVQNEVEEDNRGAFSTTEASWQNVFELCSYMSTIILSSPEQFRYPASASVLAVLLAWFLYSRFVRQRRGHLIHWPACIPGPEKRQQSWEQMTGMLQRRRWRGVAER